MSRVEEQSKNRHISSVLSIHLDYSSKWYDQLVHEEITTPLNITSRSIIVVVLEISNMQIDLAYQSIPIMLEGQQNRDATSGILSSGSGGGSFLNQGSRVFI